MKKFILILFIISKTIHAQENSKVNSIGFGLGNTISLVLKNTSFNNNGAFDTITRKPSFFIDYKNKSDSIKHFRLNIISEFSYGVTNNFDDLKLESDSRLEHVRTDIVKYLKATQHFSVNRLQANIFNNLTPNKNLEFTIDQSKKKILDFSFPISLTKKIVLKRDGEQDNFIEKIVTTKLTKKIMYKENIISSSLYRSASESEIPANLIIEFARIYGFQIDFQRDIRKKDYFQIMYEVYLDDDKKVIESGEILFANLNLSGKNNNLYFYKDSKNQGHYDAAGRSIVKTLMKTPINGARLSSKFGMRKHPIDGFNKMHRGTDFAAPLGTPIMASGDGTVIKVGWCGGGGNCVKIKHNSTYQTVYAHMSKFASRIKSGTRVKQGQIIGYVGSTGKSTGPHLHYEVIQNGKRINSQTLKMPSGKVLKGNDRKLFETQKIKLDVLKSEKIMGIS